MLDTRMNHCATHHVVASQKRQNEQHAPFSARLCGTFDVDDTFTVFLDACAAVENSGQRMGEVFDTVGLLATYTAQDGWVRYP
jgi:hypothetical protein